MSEDEDDIRKIDPRGFIRQDIDYIRKHLPRLGYQKGDTLEDVAYRQGHHDLLRYIEMNVIGRKN